MLRKRTCIGILAAATACSAAIAAAQSGVTRVPLPNYDFPISEGVWVGDTLYLSGMLDSSVAR
ncbi:MAG: hypothetical protein WA476_12700, partial [Acidobacteriaceae bacterium]